MLITHSYKTSMIYILIELVCHLIRIIEAEGKVLSFKIHINILVIYFITASELVCDYYNMSYSFLVLVIKFLIFFFIKYLQSILWWQVNACVTNLGRGPLGSGIAPLPFTLEFGARFPVSAV